MLILPPLPSTRPNPYENFFVGFHLAMTDAAKPIARAEQSKNMWKESETSPKELFQIPQTSSTKANVKLIHK